MLVYILLVVQAVAIICLGASIMKLQANVERLDNEMQYWRWKNDWRKLFPKG